MSVWLPTRADSKLAGTTELYCFPHAGGGSAIYHRWQKLLPATISLRPVKLPGREGRFNEPAISNLAEMVDCLTREVAPLAQTPLALFGHSMGALVAFEWARMLSPAKRPLALFVSACRSPDRFDPDQQSPLHQLPDPELIQTLVRNYGTDGKSTQDELTLMRLSVDCIRADLKLLETYRYQTARHQTGPPLTCPIVALVGTEDRRVTAAEVAGWQSFTTAKFRLRQIPGPHFFLRDQEKNLTSLIARTIAEL